MLHCVMLCVVLLPRSSSSGTPVRAAIGLRYRPVETGESLVRKDPDRPMALRRPQLQRVSHMHKEKSLQSLRTNLANLLSIRIYLVFLDQGRFGAPIVVPPSVLYRRPSLILLQLPVTSSPSRESTQWIVEEPSLLNGGLSLEVMKKHWFSWRRNGTQCKCKPAGRWNLFIDMLMIQMLPQPWSRWELQTLLPF